MSDPKIDNNNGTSSDNPNNNVEVNENTSVPKDEASDASSTGGLSRASSQSTLSKQSGIRPPSRIGRPCGGTQKPAIPATPTKNSSDDSIRRLTDDYGRHKLTDLLEADESEEDTLDYLKSKSPVRNRYTSLGSTASSMEGLWELHPRRLSEAGLSRHSDSSAVLTEDTDSFIIGQRVWVGGTKPGTIAYIGETQFAPGEWAGIALDEPIGKNDGSVGGTRYFQCENKKGVFSRLTRLTRVPLEQPGMGSNETFVSPNNGVRRSPVSPTGSTSGLLRSAVSLSNSTTSISSSVAHVDFKIGDRVIIKSTQGSKVGTVRYMGLTDFAPGEWVGVELDDPRGKNDGSVEGKRYFECRPNFGLFAPIAKVSKSPSKHKPSGCMVHSGPGLPPSGLKRSNSKESMTSMTSMTSRTSVASNARRVRLGVTSLTPKKVSPKTTTPIPTRTALQDVLREKQQHIEQLLKERDLERAEITRAASQADEAEQRFYDLKKDFEKYRAECEAKVRESSDILAELKIDQANLLSQLEDERRKNEDLEFKFEEASITKSDVEVINENHAAKIQELERILADERGKTQGLVGAEENFIAARNEVDGLKQRIEEEKIAHNKLIESLKKEIEKSNAENKAKSETIHQLQEEVTKNKAEHELVKRQIQESKKKSDDDCGEKVSIIEQLKSEQDEGAREIQKLKMELSSKTHDLETANEQLLERDNEIKLMHIQLETAKKEIHEKTQELERYRSNSEEVEKSLRTELAQTREDLKKKITEVEEVKKEYDVKIVAKDQTIDEINKTISQRDEELQRLNDELNGVKSSFEDTKNEMHDRHTRQIQTHESQLKTMSSELQVKKHQITQSTIMTSKLEEDLCAKNEFIDKLQAELDKFESMQAKHSVDASMLAAQLNECAVQNGHLERQLAAAQMHVRELNEQNTRLQAEIGSLSAKCDSSQQLAELRALFETKQQTIISMKAEFEEKLQNAEKERHELELRYKTSNEVFEMLKLQLEEKLEQSLHSENALKERCDNTILELTQVRDEFRVKVSELHNSIQEKELIIKQLNEKATEQARSAQEQLKLVSEDLNRNIQGCQQKITVLTQETTELKQQVFTKTEQLIAAEFTARSSTEHCKQLERELEHKYEENLKRLQFEMEEKNTQLQKTLSELQLIKQDCQGFTTDIDIKNQKISQLTIELQQSQTLVSQLQENVSTVQASHAEYEALQKQYQSLLEHIAVLTAELGTIQEDFRNLQVQYNHVLSILAKSKITEQQKEEFLKLLESTGNKGSYQRALNVLQQVKIENNFEQHTQTIVNLQKEVDIVKNELVLRNSEYETQKAELLRLQEELLKVQDCSRISTNATQENSHARL